MQPRPFAPTRGSEFLAGCRDQAPILLGVIPFGMIYGLVAVGAGLPAAAAQSMSSVIFAGSAQFIAAQLVREGAPAATVLMTVFLVNLRHALYSASVAGDVKHLRPAWKGILAYLLTDEAYAVVISRFSRDRRLGGAVSPWRHWYFLGAGLSLWATWQCSTAFGVFFGARVPQSWSLDFTLPLTFIALVFPSLKDRASGAAALSAGVAAVVAAGLPYKLGLMVAAAAGIGAGLALEKEAAA